MQAFASKLLIGLEDQLRSIEQENEVVLKRSELCFTNSKKAIEDLKTFILKYKFKSTNEEIKFFKEIKPQFTSKLIYHLMLYNIETKKPKGGKKTLRKYLVKELDKLKNYFDYNLDFYKYYRAGANYLDHKYFVRDKYDVQLTLDAYIFENDTRFSTTHDFKVAKILAHDLLQVYVENELAYLERKESPDNSQDYPKTKLTWSDSKTALIELIYALHSQGTFGNGKADIKEIASYFEQIFNIDLGEYYKTYLELRMRKTSRTKFLDSMKESLLKRMDNSDDLM
ncbi:MAG: RteC domain-containing protein [Bacteroidetes bacterium]|nr:RteC domain-containing protein [Bacteroidota bacterium]